MTSKTEIFNSALGKFSSVGSFVLNGEEEKHLDLIFPGLCDALLREHPWNFAMARASLAAASAAPAFGFARKFKKPTDPFCLRVLWAASDTAIWDVEGQFIVTDEAAPLNIKYIARITDTALFDPLFTAALTLRVAAEIAYGKTQIQSLAKGLWDKFLLVAAGARSIDGLEGVPRQMPESSFIVARG